MKEVSIAPLTAVVRPGLTSISERPMNWLPSNSEYLQLYINDPGKVPYRLPVKQGIRTTYAFPLRSDEISYFKLDPTDAGNANIDIYGIIVEGRPGDTLQLTPEEIAGWSTANVSSPRRQTVLSSSQHHG